MAFGKGDLYTCTSVCRRKRSNTISIRKGSSNLVWNTREYTLEPCVRVHIIRWYMCCCACPCICVSIHEPLWFVSMSICTDIYTYIYIYSYICTHAHIHTPAGLYTWHVYQRDGYTTLLQTCAHGMPTCVLTHTHVYLQYYIHVSVCSVIHTCTYTYTYVY